ncbi:phage holin family protein [Cellulomonas sp. URHB0016]
MSSTSGPERPRNRFFDRFTEPFAEMAREKMENAEDRVREAIQAEIDAVSASVKARAIEVRPSAVAFGVASLLGFFGLALFVAAAVLGLAHVVEPWLSALLVGTALVLLAGGFAAWARRHLPEATPMSVVRAREPVHPAGEQVHPWAD